SPDLRTKHHAPRTTFHVSRFTEHAFTLIEIMIVVAIMAIVMGMSVPFVYHALHREKLHQAIRDVEEVCANARARAIIQGSMAEVVFHGGQEVRFEVAGASGPPKDESNVPPGSAI